MVSFEKQIRIVQNTDMGTVEREVNDILTALSKFKDYDMNRVEILCNTLFEDKCIHYTFTIIY